MRIGDTVEYKGYTLVKKHKQAWNICREGKMCAYAPTLKEAKGVVERRNARGL